MGTESITLGETTYHLPYTDMYRRWNAAEEARNRASIEAVGVREPITVDEHNNVIDGANRLRVARDLKMPSVPVRVLEGLSEEEKRAESDLLNLHRRHLSPQEQEARTAARIEEEKEMRAQGFSERAIAEKVGISKQQVHKDVASSTANRLAVDDQPAAPRERQAQPAAPRTRPLPARNQEVLNWLRANGPATDAAILAAFGGHESIRQRRVELYKAGLVVDTGRTAREVGSRPRKLWAASDSSTPRSVEEQADDEVSEDEPSSAPPATPVLIRGRDNKVRRANRRADLRGVVLALLTEHPDWTQAAVAKAADCGPSYVSSVFTDEKRKAESEDALRAGVSEEDRARLEQVGREYEWSPAVLQQALMNVGNPRVPAMHKEQLLRGEADPCVYTVRGDLIGSHASPVRAARQQAALAAAADPAARTIEVALVPAAFVAAIVTHFNISERAQIITALRESLGAEQTPG